MNIKSYATAKTLTGLTIAEVLAKLQAPLPDGTYKAVPGGAKLTDIDTAYSRERLTEVFGLYGVGWGLDWNPEHITAFQETRPKYTVWIASIDYIEFWVALDVDDEEHIIRFPVTGSSENANRGFAIRGAVTNATGEGARNLLFQLHIYKGEGNVSSVPQRQRQASRPPTTSASNGADAGVRIGFKKAKELTGKNSPTLADIAAQGEDGLNYLQWVADNINDNPVGDAARRFLATLKEAVPEAPSGIGSASRGNGKTRDDVVNSPAALVSYAQEKGHKIATVSGLYGSLGLKSWPRADDEETWSGLMDEVDALEKTESPS